MFHHDRDLTIPTYVCPTSAKIAAPPRYFTYSHDSSGQSYFEAPLRLPRLRPRPRLATDFLVLICLCHEHYLVSGERSVWYVTLGGGGVSGGRG